MPVVKPEALIDDRVEAIARYHAEIGVDRAQLDISGGIDSAVMAGLLVSALGPERITLCHTIIHTDPRQTRQARDLAAAIGCRLAVGDFTPVYNTVVKELVRSLAEAGYDHTRITRHMKDNPTVEGSIRSTLRAPLGRGYNRLTGGGVRHGTGNECEDRFLRFYQKGGDGEVDTNPMEMLSKTEVYQLAFALCARLDAKDGFGPIIEAVPTPDLWAVGASHNDEDELRIWTGAPFTYGRIDPNTGRVLRAGTIEMVSRFVDAHMDDGSLFDDALTEPEICNLVSLAKQERERCFPELGPAEIETLLRAARSAEKETRHKSNPGIPSLGTRQELVDAGILTNDLVNNIIR
jgi:NH3-dependent NAD+ synthetase